MYCPCTESTLLLSKDGLIDGGLEVLKAAYLEEAGSGKSTGRQARRKDGQDGRR